MAVIKNGQHVFLGDLVEYTHNTALCIGKVAKFTYVVCVYLAMYVHSHPIMCSQRNEKELRVLVHKITKTENGHSIKLHLTDLIPLSSVHGMTNTLRQSSTKKINEDGSETHFSGNVRLRCNK